MSEEENVVNVFFAVWLMAQRPRIERRGVRTALLSSGLQEEGIRCPILAEFPRKLEKVGRHTCL